MQKKKKLLFYIPSLAPSGGIERVVTTIVNQLCQDYSITILTQDGKESFYYIDENVSLDSISSFYELDMNSRIRRAFSKFKSVVKSSVRLSKYLRKNSFDYIYITHPVSQLELLFSGVCSRKIIISEHGAEDNYNQFYRAVKKLTYSYCNSYCVPTTLDYEKYKELGFPVVYTPHYRPNLNYSRADLSKKVVLNIGRYTDDKQQLRLLSIWNDIDPSLRVNWKLNIVGNGELKEKLSEYIRDNQLEESVSLLEPRRDIDFYYASASIFALSSRSEGFGMVLLEASGFGLPLIAFDCPSGPRDIINASNGYLIDINQDNEYRLRLIDMMADHEKLLSLSNGSIELFESWSNEKINHIWKGIFK